MKLIMLSVLCILMAKVPVGTGTGTSITCCATVENSPGIFSGTITVVHCPSGCDYCPTGCGVWGTVIYSEDSKVCTAAIHDGKITANDGGIVLVEKVPQHGDYVSSEANGIETESYDQNYGAYRFLHPPTTIDTTTSASTTAESTEASATTHIYTSTVVLTSTASSTLHDNVTRTEEYTGECQGVDALYRPLAIVFGVLFAISLLVNIFFAIRHFYSSTITSSCPPTGMTEPRTHQTTANPQGSSEREVVINQIYGM